MIPISLQHLLRTSCVDEVENKSFENIEMRLSQQSARVSLFFNCRSALLGLSYLCVGTSFFTKTLNELEMIRKEIELNAD